MRSVNPQRHRGARGLHAYSYSTAILLPSRAAISELETIELDRAPSGLAKPAIALGETTDRSRRLRRLGGCPERSRIDAVRIQRKHRLVQLQRRRGRLARGREVPKVAPRFLDVTG